MKILIADPERDLLSSYKKLLSSSGHEVTTAFDGVQAVGRLYESAFDAVFVNEEIQRVDVSEIIRLSHEKKIPVILLSAEDGERRKAVPEPVKELRFPFEWSTFQSMLKKLGEEARV